MNNLCPRHCEGWFHWAAVRGWWLSTHQRGTIEGVLEMSCNCSCNQPIRVLCQEGNKGRKGRKKRGEEGGKKEGKRRED